MNRSKSLLKTRFARNTAWILLARLYQILLNLLVSVVSVRYLGPSNYGLISYAASFTALLSACCTLGIGDVMVNVLMESPEKQGKLLGTAIAMRMVSSVLSMAAVTLAVGALNPEEPLTVWVTAVYSGGVVLQSLETVQYYYQMKLMSKVTGLLTVAVRTVVAAYKVALLVTGRDVVWFAAANVVDHGVYGLLLVLAYRSGGGQRLGLDAGLGRALLRKSSPFILSGLMVALYGQMDKIMIKHLLDETQVGYYAAAVQINNLWPFVLTAIIDSARPLILELYSRDRAQFRQRLVQLYRAVIAISLAAGLALTFLAEPIVELLYGTAYQSAAPALRIVTWSTAFSYLGVARSIWMVPSGLQRYEKHLAALGAACNAALNALLIPVWGICGAAAATLLTQIVTNCLCGFLFPPLRENMELLGRAFGVKKNR